MTTGIYDITLDLTSAGSFNPSFVTAQGGINAARQALIGGLDAGRAYLNIHTNLFPAGEIRGFLTAVPASPTVAFLALGMGILALRRRSAHLDLATGRCRMDSPAMMTATETIRTTMEASALIWGETPMRTLE